MNDSTTADLVRRTLDFHKVAMRRPLLAMVKPTSKEGLYCQYLMLAMAYHRDFLQGLSAGQQDEGDQNRDAALVTSSLWVLRLSIEMLKILSGDIDPLGPESFEHATMRMASEVMARIKEVRLGTFSLECPFGYQMPIMSDVPV